MTIYEIKRRTADNLPYYFSSKTLKFFGQTLKAFKVYKQTDGRYFITCPIRDRNGKIQGHTERYYNPVTNNLDNK